MKIDVAASDVKAKGALGHPYIAAHLPKPYKVMLKKPVSRDGRLNNCNSPTDNTIRTMAVEPKSRFFTLSCQSVNFAAVFIKGKQKLEPTHDCHLVERSSTTSPEF